MMGPALDAAPDVAAAAAAAAAAASEKAVQ